MEQNQNFPSESLVAEGQLPASPAALAGSETLDFTPVPVRARRDGWMPARQFAFIAALRLCRCVLEACRRVGMSSESAYKLARRPDAQSFRAAWRAALAGPRPPRPSTSAPQPGQTQWQVSSSSSSSTSAAPPEAQWQASDSSASSTSAPQAERKSRHVPAYSLAEFVRLAGAFAALRRAPSTSRHPATNGARRSRQDHQLP